MMASYNRMGEALSPYLLQHADNPVHWQPWGPEAFAEAAARDVPVLLSVGYAACHWCHVMAHESFEDETLAAQMNRDFVCIKVDREERPDVDAVYMAATQAMNQGRGGWPMTVLMTPEKTPFFAGTYFPPTARHGMPGFADLLRQVANLWQHQRKDIEAQALQVAQAVQPQSPPASDGLPTAAGAALVLQQACNRLSQRYDPVYGGFTREPKFPHSEVLRFGLMRGTQDPALLRQVHHTLAEMARGGLYDLVGGGFSRYSVDDAWHVPHFEKMLYDNALLVAAYAQAYQQTPYPRYADIVRETLGFIAGELTAQNGTFYASLDADSEGHEGKFYVWTYAEAHLVLATEFDTATTAAILADLGITETGNWEHGVNIVRLSQSEAEIPLSGQLQRGLALLFAARSARVRPGTDHKILSGHNGLMLTALATASSALGDAQYLMTGCQAADALWATAWQEETGLLARTQLAPGQWMPGILEDYAYLAEGLLALYEAGGKHRYLVWAEKLCHQMVAQFADADTGALFDTGNHHEALLFRTRDSHDGATPSASATAAHTLLRLAVHTGQPALHHAGTRALSVNVAEMNERPDSYCRTLIGLAFAHHSPSQAILMGAAMTEKGFHPLLQPVLATFSPHRVIGHGLYGQDNAAWPLLAHREQLAPQDCLYLCADFTCGPPLTQPSHVQRAMQPS